MDVVGHQAKTVDAAAVLFYDILEKMVEPEPVAVIEENRLPGVTAKNNMVDCAGKMDARFTCHDHVIIESMSSLGSGLPFGEFIGVRFAFLLFSQFQPECLNLCTQFGIFSGLLHRNTRE